MKTVLRMIAGMVCTVLLLGVVGCSSTDNNSDTEQEKWKTDVAVDTLCAAVQETSAGATLAEAVDQTTVELEMSEIDISLCTDMGVFMPDGTSLDEFGVFRAKDETSALQVEQMLTNYLHRRNDEWTGMYLIEEYPKLEKAKVQRNGLYVTYVILDEKEASAALKAVKELLKG